jgi:hypothetical protein
MASADSLRSVATAHQKKIVSPVHSQHHSANDVKAYAQRPLELQPAALSRDDMLITEA